MLIKTISFLGFIVLSLSIYVFFLDKEVELKDKQVTTLKKEVKTSKIDTNLTSISFKAIGELKQLNKEEKNEKKPLGTIGTHNFIF